MDREPLPVALRGRRLRAGDRVRFVSPASYPDAAALQAMAATVRSWGLEAEIGPHALDERGFLAGSDADRLADLNDAFRDPGVRAVIATRGGAGAYRISGGLDLDAVRADPKPLVGFSDVTHLHLALWRGARLATVHGSLACDDAAESLRRALMTAGPITVDVRTMQYGASLTTAGVTGGPLVGGNLAALAFAVGVDLPSLRGAIVLLEAPRTVGIGQLDRALVQLRRSGALEGIAGVALGQLPGFEDYTDRGWTALEVLGEHLVALDVPVLAGLPLGHGVDAHGRLDHLSVPLGTAATLDADARRLVVEPPVR